MNIHTLIKTKKNYYLLLLLFSISFFSPSLFAQVKINFSNAKRIYSVGEKISLRISSNGFGNGTYELTYDPTNSNSTFQKGNFTAGPGQDGFINFTLSRAAMVFVRVNQNGSDAKTIAVDPFKIQLFEDDPADFDAFWQSQKSKLAAVPMNPQLSEIQTLPNGSKLYIIQLDQIDNRKVYGYICVPAGGGKYPAILSLPPFGTSPLQAEPLILTDFAEKCGAISMAITIHNAPPNQTDPNAYKPDNLDKREEYYARYMILGSLRAVEYLLSRPDFNGTLGVTGNSQGGGLTACVAGLENRITAIMPIASAFMEQDGWRYNYTSGFPNYAKSGKSLNLDTNAVHKAMKYYDSARFLKRYKGVMMYQTGYNDDLTSAHSQLTGYNLHRGKSFFLHLMNRAHDYPFNEYFLGRYAFFAQTLKDFKNFSNFKMELNINAGNDKNVSTNSADLEGIVTINGGSNSPTNIRWTKIEGPGNVTFSNGSALKTTAQFSQAGTYIVKLTADYDYLINNEFEPAYYTLADYITITVGNGSGNACNNDNTPPVISNCPQNINISTQGTSATATWNIPTATDNCSTPSVSSTHNSGSSFPIGTTTVTYSANDTKNNTSTCSFTVTITQQIGSSDNCITYKVSNTHDTCSCSFAKWSPYTFNFADNKGCPREYFISDSDIQFIINSDGNAILQGTFRSQNWDSVIVNAIFSGRTTTPPKGSPNIIYCPLVGGTSNAAAWQYFPTLSGTIKVGNRPPLSIERRGAAFQLGIGANNQNFDKLGASGNFRLSDGRIGSFGFVLQNEATEGCVRDIAVSITTEKATYTKRSFMNYTLKVQNISNQPFKNVVVEFPFPIGTVTGGNVTASSGIWKEWCVGNNHCYQWEIPNLSVGGSETLIVPVYIQDINTPIVANIKLISSIPTENNSSNNEATFTLLPKSENNIENVIEPTALVPVVINNISPNPSEGDLIIDYNSLIDTQMTFYITNSLGNIIRVFTRDIKKGQNAVFYDTSDMFSGIYFVMPTVRNVAQVKYKFVRL